MLQACVTKPGADGVEDWETEVGVVKLGIEVKKLGLDVTLGRACGCRGLCVLG